MVERAEYPAGDGVSATLTHATVYHAVMRGLHGDRDAARLQGLFDCVICAVGRY